jgi:amino acid transporter
MSNGSLVDRPAGAQVSRGARVNKGLKRNAISFISNVIIGISSTAPAYSLASTLGLIASFATFGSPAILIVAFIPMLFIAVAYSRLNQADPDCGTTFSWVTRALGPRAGWMGGWAIIVTDIMVMPALAGIAGQYSLKLFWIDDPTQYPTAVTLIGVAWIVVMTGSCYLGIEFSARTQQLLLGAELLILVIFAVVALAEVYVTHAPGSQPVSLNWFNPFVARQFNDFTEGVLAAVFIYWGWDCGVSINEETENSATTPGRAAIVSTIVLLGIYLFVAAAATAVAGPDLLAKNSDDIFAAIGANVLGSRLDALLILVVLTSATAATQTTILPTARTVLSMADAEAVPKQFAEVNPRFLSPGFATLTMGVISIVWYVGLSMISQDTLGDSILALGLGIAFYYALTGFACVVYFRRKLLTSAGSFFLDGVLPGLGALIMVALFVKSCFDLAKPGAGKTVILGVGGPLVIGLGALLFGLVLMVLAQYGLPAFFTRKPEVANIVPAASSRA